MFPGLSFMSYISDVNILCRSCLEFAWDSFLKYSFAISMLLTQASMKTIAFALLISGVSSAALLSSSSKLESHDDAQPEQMNL